MQYITIIVFIRIVSINFNYQVSILCQSFAIESMDVKMNNTMFFFLFFFLDIKEEKYFMHGVWDSQRTCVPTKSFPSSQATWSLVTSIKRKARNYKPRALNETMLPMRRKKSLIISHTQNRIPPILTPISTKKKEWGREKKKETHTGSKKK